MRRGRALACAIAICFLIVLAIVAAIGSLKGDGTAQTAEVADPPAKIADRAPAAPAPAARPRSLARPRASLAPTAFTLRAPPQAGWAPATASASLRERLLASGADKAEPQPWIAAPNTGGGFWTYNGSVLHLEASGRTRRFSYAGRPEGERGIVFEGVREGPVFSGQAFAFSESCPPVAYPVKGSVNAEETIIRLRGSQPLRDGQCHVTGHFEAELVLTSLKIGVLKARTGGYSAGPQPDRNPPRDPSN